MTTAAVVGQIEQVMSEAEKEVAVTVLKRDGTVSEATIDHRKVCDLLGGTPTVVGAIRALSVQAVALRGAKGEANKHKLPEASFEPSVKGDIVLLRTADDELGTPLGFAKAEFEAWVAQGMPEGESDEEEGEEAEDSDEEEVVEFGELDEAALRTICEGEGLSTKGVKKALIARIVEKMQQEEDDEDDDEEEEDGDEEDEDEDEVEEDKQDEDAPKVPATSGRGAKRSAPPAASKKPGPSAEAAAKRKAK